MITAVGCGARAGSSTPRPPTWPTGAPGWAGGPRRCTWR